MSRKNWDLFSRNWKVVSDPVAEPVAISSIKAFEVENGGVSGLSKLWRMCDGVEVEAEREGDRVFIEFYSRDAFLDMLLGYHYRERLGANVVAFAGDGGDLMLVHGAHPVLGDGVYVVPCGAIDWVESRVVRVGATVDDVLFGDVVDDVVALHNRDWRD
jgi:hypothetical protein